MKTGAIILAAGKPKEGTPFQPLVKTDGVTAIRRLIILLKHSGVSPITVITGEQAEALEKEVSHMDVICLRNPDYPNMRMFGSVQIGLRYMEDLCERLLILSPRFFRLLPQTISAMLSSTSSAACTIIHGQPGHPVMIRQELFASLKSYDGTGGLRAFLDLPGISSCLEKIPAEDHDAELPFYFTIDLALHREDIFFHRETAHFLALIAHTGSMQTACRQMHISYSKGWKIIKTAETFLGYPLLATQSGGFHGGSSCLTSKGEVFLKRYLAIEEQLNQTASRLFAGLFPEGEL